MKTKTNWIYSRSFALLCMVLVMLNNLEASAFVYLRISHNPLPYEWMNVALAILVVLIIDLSIISFIVHDRKAEAGIFAFAVFMLNILYYDGLSLFSANAVAISAQLIYSGMFAYSIHAFSKLWSSKLEVDTEVDNTSLLLEQQVTELSEQLTKYKQLVVCSKCGEEFKSQAAKNGHQRTCKK